MQKKYICFINLSDDNVDEKRINEKDFSSTLCLINAIKARRPLFDHTLPLSERSESIKNKLWNEVYDELQGTDTLQFYLTFIKIK